ncbi:MAG: uroporphyrinogen decarboxylase family protein [Anaerolineae bacterium]
MMNGRERFQTAMRHEEPDRVPLFELAINNRVAKDILGRDVFLVGAGSTQKKALEVNMKGREARRNLILQSTRDQLELFAKVGLDAAMIRTTDYLVTVYQAEQIGVNGIHNPKIEQIEENMWKTSHPDGFWTTYKYDDINDVLYLMDDNIKQGGYPELEKYVEYLESASLEINEPIADALEAYKLAVNSPEAKDMAILGHADICYPCFLPFHTVFLEAMAEEQELAERFMAATTEGMMVFLKAQLDLGVDGIVATNDWCYNMGPLMSPKMFDRFLAPYLQMLADECHRRGVPFIKHLDGNTKVILDSLVNYVGIDGLHAIEPPAGMDIGELKTKYGDKITLLGNVDCAHTLVTGSKKDVAEEVKNIIRIASPGGGHILSSSNSIHAGVPTENFLVMLETAKKYGRYPISI